MSETEQGLKMVIIEIGTKVSVGIHTPKCDPVITVVPGRIEEALPGIAALIAEARARWAQSPLNPKSEREIPKPQPPVRTPAQPAAAGKPGLHSPAPKKKDPLQKNFF